MKGDNPDLWNQEIEKAAMDQIYWNDADQRYHYKISDSEQIDYLRSEWNFTPQKWIEEVSDNTSITIMVALNHHREEQDALKYTDKLKTMHSKLEVIVFKETDHLIMLDKPNEFVRFIQHII